MNIHVCNEYSELDFISNTYMYTCIIYNEYFSNGHFFLKTVYLQNSVVTNLSKTVVLNNKQNYIAFL